MICISFAVNIICMQSCITDGKYLFCAVKTVTVDGVSYASDEDLNGFTTGEENLVF